MRSDLPNLDAARAALAARKRGGWDDVALTDALAAVDILTTELAALKEREAATNAWLTEHGHLSLLALGAELTHLRDARDAKGPALNPADPVPCGACGTAIRWIEDDGACGGVCSACGWTWDGLTAPPTWADLPRLVADSRAWFARLLGGVARYTNVR